MILNDFKSFVLKVCESKGFTDAFLGKCVNLKELAQMTSVTRLVTGENLGRRGGSMFEKESIVILQRTYYHRGT